MGIEVQNKEVVIMHTVNDVANWFLANMENVTNKKLQKLAYYAYSWHLVLNNDIVERLDVKLFDNKFEAWVHGAVYPDLYFAYRQYGSGYIPKYTDDVAEFSSDDLEVLNQIVEVYGGYTGNQLESICHQESPWQNARAGLNPYDASNNPIEDSEIFKCYSARL